MKSKRVYNSIEEREKVLMDEYTDILGEGVVQMMIWKGFCSAPASTKYHGAYKGGLFDHSIAVADCLQDLTEKLGLHWYNENSPIRIGMLHDLCKIDCYKDVSPIGSNLEVFEWDNSPVIKGHGEKSALYAMRYGATLSEEELACIIYHMGVYGCDQNGMNAFNHAVEVFPNVLYTHLADMEASKLMGV